MYMSRTICAGGLHRGDEIVINGVHNLSNGVKVR